MAKVRTRTNYVCTNCGYDTSKWHGQCPECKEWNCFKELRIDIRGTQKSNNGSKKGFTGESANLQKLNEIRLEEQTRFSSGFDELDRVLGGGFVLGSSILIGGHPGAGKSTLLLQTLCHLAQNKSTLYVSGEESMQQIAARSHRLALTGSNLSLLSETSVENILNQAYRINPAVLVIDSIQVMYADGIDAAPGGVAQVKESAATLTRFAKQTGTVILMIGHVTKDHSLAGPMTLSHIVDTQLMITNADDNRFRMIRVLKNRFGQVNELGVFAMTEKGLKEVKNPSAIFLNRSIEEASGSAVTVLWEGTRPLLVEIQALLADSQLGNPRRVAVGVDHNRISMLLAILFRHGGIFTSDQDVFMNVVGGVRINETSADLACLLAIISSLRNKPLPKTLIAFGEVGLSGEVRPVSNGQQRIIEANKHGFKKAIVPKANSTGLSSVTLNEIEVIAVNTLGDVLNIVS